MLDNLTWKIPIKFISSVQPRVKKEVNLVPMEKGTAKLFIKASFQKLSSFFYCLRINAFS